MNGSTDSRSKRNVASDEEHVLHPSTVVQSATDSGETLFLAAAEGNKSSPGWTDNNCSILSNLQRKSKPN